MSYGSWGRYVSVGERRAKAIKKMAKLKKAGENIQPVTITGRTIAKTFWGKAWCDHLEGFHDFENRLPRGRTYARNGSICHLEIGRGTVKAYVQGSSLYTVRVEIDPLPDKKWQSIKKSCQGKISSLIDLLQGTLSKGVMEVVTDAKTGLFPLKKEIAYTCSCPDYADMCKHVSAVFYGIGARLDEQPELLFLLRGVDSGELISLDLNEALDSTKGRQAADHLDSADLSDIFGIELQDEVEAPSPEPAAPLQTAQSAGKTTTGSKTRKKPAAATVAKAKIAAEAPTAPAYRKTKVPAATGKRLVALQKKFGLTKTDLARLMGVSYASVLRWQSQPGKLKLNTTTQATYDRVSRLTKAEARQQLKKNNS
jgi:uncharacterized Zn finger protein